MANLRSGCSETNLETGSRSDYGAEKQAQLTATLQWADENYQWSDGVCVPRCVLFQHYQDFCSKTGFVSVGPATFGKIIRQRFPKLTTRRLGTRGQSRYHYYGIGIKPSSPYYRQTCTGTGLSRFSRVKAKMGGWFCGQKPKPNGASRLGTILPDLPQLEDLQITNPEIELDKVQTFLVMYKTHCQRILDAIVAANFNEIENLLLHFWKAMPEHMLAVINDESLVKLIAAYDHVLYKIINDVLIPSTFQEIPDSLYVEISTFVNNFHTWLVSSLISCPTLLKSKKTEVAAWFLMAMKRHLSFIRLTQICRSFLCNSESTRQIARDLNTINISAICVQLSSTAPTAINHTDRIIKYYDSLVLLLIKQAPFEDYMEWMDEVIDEYFSMDDSNGHFEEVPSNETLCRFVLCWSYSVSLIIRDLTLENSTSFGLIHVFNLMLNEYVYVVMETQRIRRLSQAMRSDVVTNCLKRGSGFSLLLIGLEVGGMATGETEKANNKFNAMQQIEGCNQQPQDSPGGSTSTLVVTSQQNGNWVCPTGIQRVERGTSQYFYSQPDLLQQIISPEAPQQSLFQFESKPEEPYPAFTLPTRNIGDHINDHSFF